MHELRPAHAFSNRRSPLGTPSLLLTKERTMRTEDDGMTTMEFSVGDELLDAITVTGYAPHVTFSDHIGKRATKRLSHRHNPSRTPYLLP